MPYPVMNTLLDDGFPKGALNYWLSSFTNGLTDALIDTAVERYAAVPSPMTPMLFEHFHGAVTRIEPTATAVPHREPGWNLLIPSVWADPADDGREHRVDEGDARGAQARAVRPPLAQLPRRRPGRRRDPRRLRPQLRPAARAQAPLRPGERLPPEPQHRSLATLQPRQHEPVAAADARRAGDHDVAVAAQRRAPPAACAAAGPPPARRRRTSGRGARRRAAAGRRRRGPWRGRRARAARGRRAASRRSAASARAGRSGG